ncbi:BrnA antitoxin family protein [Bordetella genomosp. 13]|uniref:BrnA antitoxin family protein n=1 Tax=Bordetella genomosp. 13 TaxID=463040 RepID=UPI0021B67280|nr:BrnA antitoxin family protein [Bordetella genomosp. 13]
MPKNTDPDMTDVEAALLQSLDQAVTRQFARVHTPEQIEARRRGRPVGSTAEVRKAATTIRFDEEVLRAFKATGKGWQTRMNEALKDWLRTHQPG